MKNNWNEEPTVRPPVAITVEIPVIEPYKIYDAITEQYHLTGTELNPDLMHRIAEQVQTSVAKQAIGRAIELSIDSMHTRSPLEEYRTKY